MATIKIKGYEFTAAPIRDSFDRRALQLRNKIIESLGKIGLTEDDIDLNLEPSAIRSAPAYVSWYLEGYHLHFSYKAAKRHADNLLIVQTVIRLEVDALLSGKKTIDEFIHDFSEESDIKEQRRMARETLGVAPEETNLDTITESFKKLAKKYHPDMPEGELEKFKKINLAHKMLRRELQ